MENCQRYHDFGGVGTSVIGEGYGLHHTVGDTHFPRGVSVIKVIQRTKIGVLLQNLPVFFSQ